LRELFVVLADAKLKQVRGKNSAEFFLEPTLTSCLQRWLRAATHVLAIFQFARRMSRYQKRDLPYVSLERLGCRPWASANAWQFPATGLIHDRCSVFVFALVDDVTSAFVSPVSLIQRNPGNSLLNSINYSQSAGSRWCLWVCASVRPLSTAERVP